MANPLVSVIIPHYNHQAYLPKAIESVLAQSYPMESVEIIIVNDDPTISLAEYRKFAPNIRIIQNVFQKGVAACLNEGIKVAQGEYVAFQDADNWSMTRRLESSVHQMLIDDSDLLYGDFIALKRNRKPDYFTARPFSKEDLCRRCPSDFGTIMVRTRIAKKIKFPEDIGYGMDMVWWLRVSKATEKFSRLHLPLMYYQFEASNFRKFQSVPIVRKIQRLSMRVKLRRQMLAELHS
ncbi:MAG: glycosyltransferase [Acidobacteriia bacterium]|nr:glycosyltransferase [Terriglobia bacterium]